jgi:hypothetical protein
MERRLHILAVGNRSALYSTWTRSLTGTEKDNGFDISTYHRSGKVTDPTICSLLCRRMVDRRGSSGVNGYDVSVKVAQLSGAVRAQRRGTTMIRLAIVFCISLTKISPLGQSASKYQMGTTTGVKTHLEAGGGPTDAASYDVSPRPYRQRGLAPFSFS